MQFTTMRSIIPTFTLLNFAFGESCNAGIPQGESSSIKG
jgi:hypothetical protein